MAKSKAGSRPAALGPIIGRVFWLAVVSWAGWQLYARRERGEWPWTWLRSSRLEGVQLLSRAAWSALPEGKGPARLGRPRRITVHHLGGKAAQDADREAAGRTVKAVQDDHMRRRGWNDIGYHFIIDRAGRVWEGRPVTRLGAHAGSAAANAGNIGVALVGNFDLQEPPAAQLDACRRLLDALRAKYRIARAEVRSHEDVRRECGLGGTSCPGKHLGPWLDRYQRGAGEAGRTPPEGRGGAASRVAVRES